MRDAMMKSLFDLARNDSNVMLLTGDLGYGVFEGFASEFPKQFLNVGVAEQNMIGIASGLALEGKIIFVYSIANFPTLRCLEQIRSDACYHELNININLSPQSAIKCLNETNICFLFAPLYHESFKYVAKTRSEIKTRTIFNILGPLCNPGNVKVHLLGVYNKNWLTQ